MQAGVVSRYGDLENLEIKEVPVPEPAAGEVRVRIRAIGLNDTDYALITGKPLFVRLFTGLRRPKYPIPGCDIAGEVDSVGPGVGRFRPGDRVFGDLTGTFGGFAEYVCCDESALARMSSEMDFVDAAALPQAGTLALQSIEAGEPADGMEILINGAGGGMGILALQLLRKRRSVRITGVDSASKLPDMRDAGFDEVLDYRRTDFTRTGSRYDLILDTRTKRWPAAYLRALKPSGRYVTVGGSMPRFFALAILGLLKRPLGGRRLIVVAQEINYGLAKFRDLAVEGVLKPRIDGPYPFSELRERLAYFLRAEHRGKVVLTVE
ncbi:MAG TPA: NAD(P)-dependent alcohol dehydrogenase [Candidatus Krumholzibacteria bacterium]|nr:NAD(P)-dependent alcohol dehydrogenase [Candidatus Krumholzibacteria bacterium]